LPTIGLHTLYLGLESGSDEVLRSMGKGGTVRDMIDGCIRAQNAGLSVSVMVLVGLGGQELSATHARQTAVALNAMQPALLSCLRLVPIPAPLWRAASRTGASSRSRRSSQYRNCGTSS
jgi:radical SAM superfamily enzyme YgiQ (UPF0313 family)